jgi:hypothetical protein
MYGKETTEILKKLNKISDAVTAASDPSSDIQAAKKAVKDLRTLLVGTSGMVIVYDCLNASVCGRTKACHIEIEGGFSDLKFCLDSLVTGDANFTQTGTK